ncbi:MAG: T9SS type A sorting domain-containing protein [Bacteroidales bacterium]|nr:T9SS type A sorting domain-containing protein [Bacteroidales bacterium]
MKKILFVLLGALLMLTGIGKTYAQENIIPIRDQVAGFDTWTDTDVAGTSYIQLLKSTSSTVTPAMNFDNYTNETLNFKARTYGGTNVGENTVTVSISTNNGVDWTILGTRLPLTNSLTNMDEFDLSTYNGTEVKIKFHVEGTLENIGAGIDDISITGLAPAVSTLAVNPEILSGFNYIVGSGPSAEQSFALSGTVLDNSDVIITPPTNYEISLTSGGTFQSTAITLATYDGADTEVYVRLISGLAVADYNSEIINISGGGANDVNVTCNGSVSAIPSPTLTANPDVLTGLNYTQGSGPSAEQSFILSGTVLDGSDVVITPPTNYEISLSSGGTFQNTAITLATYDGADTEVYVRLISGLAIADYNSEMITISGGNASDISVECNGSVLDPSLVPCLAEDFSGFTAGAHGSPSSTDVATALDDYTQVPGWEGYKIYSAGGEIKLGTSSLNGYIITPAVDLSAGGTLIFDYAFWSESDASSVQVFHASDGTNFVQIGVDLTPTLDFQSYSVNIADGTTLSKIKIGTDVKRAYLDNIEVYCNGFLPIPTLTSNPTSLSGFNYIVDLGPSDEQSFELSGTDLDNSDIIITPPTNYEVSLTSGGTFQSTAITIPTYDGTATDIYVRLISGLAVADYNSETINISGGGSSDVNITCNGSVSAIPSPTLTANPDVLTGLNYIQGSGPSAEQSFILSGTVLDGSDVVITPPTNYEISLNSGGTFQNTAITLATYDGADTEVYVRLISGLAVADYNSEMITISGGNASDITVECSGSVSEYIAPTLTTEPSILSGFNYLFGFGPSPEQMFTLTGASLDNSDVIITPPANYEVSLTSGAGFQSSAISIPTYDGTATDIYVRLIADLAVADYNLETIAITGGGADAIAVVCNGSVTDGSGYPCLEEDFSGFTTGSHETPSTSDAAAELDDYTMVPGWTGYKIYSAGGEIKIGTGSLNGYIITPAIDLTDGGSLNFDYAKWNVDVSVIQIFHAADGENFVQVGSDITPETEFQSYSLQITDGSAMSKIKIATDVKRAFLDNIKVFCGNFSPTPVLTANPTSLSGFTYVAGFGPSDEQYYTLSGTFMDGNDVIINPSTNYEVSLSSGTDFQSTPITITAFDGTATEVYVRLISGLTVGDYNSELTTINGGGADEISVTCSGTVEEYVNTSQFLTDDEISIYPNPTSDFVNIVIENCDSETVNIKIFDMMGKIVFSNEFNVQNGSINEKIDFSNFSSGLYHINILDKDSSVNRKVTLR